MAKKYGMEKDVNLGWFGHGTGIIISEPPFINYGIKDVIKSNTFVNIEPGIFLPDIGRCFLEDATFITEKGAEFVTSCPRELHIG